MTVYKSFVGNKFVDNGNEFEVLDNNTNKVIHKVTAVKQEEIKGIVDKAANAQKSWRKLSSYERGELLKKVAENITAKASEIGKVLADEIGSKSVADATNEAIYAGQITDFHAGWARRIEG